MKWPWLLQTIALLSASYRRYWKWPKGRSKHWIRQSVLPALRWGDPTVADVHVNGSNAFLLTGVAPGTTSLMVWTACSKSPRQSMVFVKGKAATSYTSVSILPSEDPTLPSQVQTDIRFVEVNRTKMQEASTSIFGMGKDFLFGSPGSFISNAENVITRWPGS